MATIKHGERTVTTNGELPKVGTKAPNFELIGKDLKTVDLSKYAGKRVVLNIFPSIDTGTCATSVRTFNKRAAEFENTAILCISRDLPFAQSRFCGAEGIENVENLSDYSTGEFGKAYGVNMEDGILKNLHARAIVVLDENGTVIHNELIPDIPLEPNYDAALAALK